ncbi:unnamed protein product [Effrenium voratum]|nr:unnamed protein product [Effrenium voratum]
MIDNFPVELRTQTQDSGIGPNETTNALVPFPLGSRRGPILASTCHCSPALMWKAKSGSKVETADLSSLPETSLVDPLAAAVGDGTICVLLSNSLVVLAPEGNSNMEVKEAESLEGFFTRGAGNKCAALVADGQFLAVGRNKLLIVDCKSNKARVIDDSRWCMCAADGPVIYLADKEGSVFQAEHPLSNASFPGKVTEMCKFDGSHTDPDGDCMRVTDFGEDDATMRPRDSGSVIGALAVQDGAIFACKGHGLLSHKDGVTKEVLKDERSAQSFAFPAALFLLGATAFAQCPDGIRMAAPGGPVSLALKAGDMVFEDDSGSPQPYPKDFIGLDAKFLYFLVERDFFSGMALRRSPHGRSAARASARAGSARAAPAPLDAAHAEALEMKVTAKKGARFYIRSAENMLKGIEAKPAVDGREAVEAKSPVEHLRISALGNAIDVAVAVATSVAESGLAQLRRTQTTYVSMESAGVPQILIDLQKL